MASKRSSGPSTVGVGPWLGVRSINDPYAIPPNYLSDASNVYIADGKGGSGAYARPGFRKVVHFGSVSDAIFRPRLYFTDGFGAGAVQTIGVNVPVADVAGILTDPAALKDPFTGSPGTGINQLQAFGRYRFTSGDTHHFDLGGGQSLEYQAFSERWVYVATGGRAGGYIESRADGISRGGGHWNGIEVRADAPDDGVLGIVVGMDLQGVAIPSTGITCIAFVSAFVANQIVHNITNPYYGIIPYLVVTILPDRTIELRRLTVATQPGHSPNYYGTGTWTAITDPSSFVVPATGFFTIEAAMATPATQTIGNGAPFQVTNGVAYARLYTAAFPFGQSIRALNVVTAAGQSFKGGGGVAYGTDCRGEFGDGAGNVTQGVAGIRFDGVAAYDNGGTRRRYLYDCRVGTSFPTTQVVGESTAHGTTRVANVARSLNALTGLQSTYNRYTAVQRDLFLVTTPVARAAEILGVSPFKCTDPALASPSDSAGVGKVIIDVAGHEAVQAAPGSLSVTNLIDEMLVVEQNPATSAPFTPLELGTSVRLGYQRVASSNSDTAAFQLGLEYVFREQLVPDADATAVAPFATFGVDASSSPSIDFQDTSRKYDGAIVSNHWNWGDTTTSDNVGSQAISGSQSAHHTHVYAVPGTYTVTLTVTGDDGSIATVSHTVVVPNQIPIANFTVSQSPASLIAAFTDTSTDADGTVASWAWDFGDSQTSTSQNPSHTYSGAGTYTVTLTVTDNLGGVSTPASHSVTAPPAAPDCAEFATTPGANIQGDDYAGGNPPLTSYANTAAYDVFYRGGTFRETYDTAYDSINDGVSHAMDTGTTFNGRPTLTMTFGDTPAPSGHARYVGAGWATIPTDDASPVENYYAAPFGPTEVWMRVRWKAAAGVMSDAGATAAFAGLEAMSFENPNMAGGVYIRGGRVKLDVSTRLVVDGVMVTNTYDLGAETLFVGRSSGYGELVLYYKGDNTAHTVRTMAWAGDSCSLTGASPLADHSVTAAIGSSGSSLTRALAVRGYSFFDAQFTPAGANKLLRCTGWSIRPATLASNPFSVALT